MRGVCHPGAQRRIFFLWRSVIRFFALLKMTASRYLCTVGAGLVPAHCLRCYFVLDTHKGCPYRRCTLYSSWAPTRDAPTVAVFIMALRATKVESGKFEIFRFAQNDSLAVFVILERSEGSLSLSLLVSLYSSWAPTRDAPTDSLWSFRCFLAFSGLWIPLNKAHYPQ